MAPNRKIKRYFLCCPILLSPSAVPTEQTTLLSLTKNVSAKGVYVHGSCEWPGNLQVFGSLFYEVQLFSRQQKESRFLIRFQGEVIRNEELGFALRFSTTKRIVPLSMTDTMTVDEEKVAENIDFLSVASGRINF